jgi:hypothetical protein
MKYVATVSINLGSEKNDAASRECETIEEALQIFPADSSKPQTDSVRSDVAFNCLTITERGKIVAVYMKMMNKKTNGLEWVKRELNDKEFAANEALVKSALEQIERQINRATTEDEFNKLHERLQTEMTTDIDDLPKANPQYKNKELRAKRQKLANRCGTRIEEIRRRTGT